MHSTPTRLRMVCPQFSTQEPAPRRFVRAAFLRKAHVFYPEAASTPTERAADPAGQACSGKGPDRRTRPKRIEQTRRSAASLRLPPPSRSFRSGVLRHRLDASCTLRHFLLVRGKMTGYLPYPEPPTAWRATPTRPLPSIRRLARCVLGEKQKQGEDRGCPKGQRKRSVKKGKRNGRAKKSTKVLLTRKCDSHDTPVALVIVFPL